MSNIQKSLMNECMLKYTNDSRTEFYSKCGILVYITDKTPILKLGIEKYHSFITELKNLTKCIHKYYYLQEEIKKDSPIREVIPSICLSEYIDIFNSKYLSYFELLNLENRNTIYFVIEYEDCKIDSKLIIEKFDHDIQALLRKYGLLHSSFSSNNAKQTEILDFLCLCAGIYSSYMLNSQKDSSQYIDEKYGHFKIKSQYTKNEFFNFINHKLINIKSDVINNISFQSQNNRANKALREELIVINNYVQHKKFDDDTIIYLGLDTQRWDAKINDTVIEVTQAIYKDEHLVRRGLCNINGFRGLSLRLRTINQTGIDSFPAPIIDAIKNKKRKKYDDSRTLIICTLFEFAIFNRAIINEWIDYIKQNITFKEFDEVYLGIDNSCLFKL